MALLLFLVGMYVLAHVYTNFSGFFFGTKNRQH